MERAKVVALRRKKVGKGDAKRLRRKGLIPAILYGGGENISLQLNAKELLNVFSKGENVIVDLSIEDGGERIERTVILKDKQIHPIKRNWIHVDFYEISLEEKLETKVPITICGVSPGVEEGGGILEHITREVTVRCLPTKIPEHIEVNISNLGIGDALSVEDLKVDEGVEILDDAKKLVVHVLPPIVEKEAEEVVEEVVEPERVEEKKEEE